VGSCANEAGDATKPGSAEQQLDPKYIAMGVNTLERVAKSGDLATVPSGTFGNAPRTLPCVYSPWRNNADLSVSKQTQTGGGTALSPRLEVLNLFNLVHWAAPASSAVGNRVVRADS
jgi:hypothetical protein